MTTNGNGTANVPNLRETRKEMAAAKPRHPAGKAAPAKQPAKAPAATAAAKAPAKAAAKKAPAKVAAKKAGAAKVHWTPLAERTAGNRAVEQDATCDGHTWQIRRAEGGWTVSQDGTLLTSQPFSYAKAGQLVLAQARKVAGK